MIRSVCCCLIENASSFSQARLCGWSLCAIPGSFLCASVAKELVSCDEVEPEVFLASIFAQKFLMVVGKGWQGEKETGMI